MLYDTFLLPGGGSHGKKEAGSAVLLSTFFSTMQPLHTPRRKKQRRERSRLQCALEWLFITGRVTIDY